MLYLIRHEEPEQRGVFLGRGDPPLSERGREDAAKLAEISAAAVYSSPLRRALETAAAIDAPLLILPELAEMDFGEWEGRTWQEIERGWPELAALKLADWLGTPAPAGETWAALAGRVNRALERILAGPMPAAVVAHLTVNAAIAAKLTGADPKEFQQDYGQIIVYDTGSRESRARRADRRALE